ncbi:GIY-YIG catalytic domain-containing protein [Bacillus sp. AG236]|nr:GIY-YIG catalytic domain-containing protein [Bacillus sp. AG236]
MKITRAEAVEQFGNDICKRHFQKHESIKSIDIEYVLIRTMLQYYENVTSGGYGKSTYYILNNQRLEPIKFREVRLNSVSNARNSRVKNRTGNRAYPDDFYRNDTCTIYIATNIVTNEVYVGSTIRGLARRISEHKSNAYNINSASYNTEISQAIRKYGFTSLKWDIIQHWDDRETLKHVEDLCIMNCRGIVVGYNSRFNNIKIDIKEYKEAYLERKKIREQNDKNPKIKLPKKCK